MFESNINKTEFIRKILPYFKIGVKVIYYWYLFMKKGYTEGQFLYNVKFKSFTNIKIAIYIITKILLPFVIKQIDDYIVIQENRDRFVFKVYKLFSLVLKGLDFYNFINFLITNKYPSLFNRILDLEYVLWF